jgi:hypothetical protein
LEPDVSLTLNYVPTSLIFGIVVDMAGVVWIEQSARMELVTRELPARREPLAIRELSARRRELWMLERKVNGGPWQSSNG